GPVAAGSRDWEPVGAARRTHRSRREYAAPDHAAAPRRCSAPGAGVVVRLESAGGEPTVLQPAGERLHDALRRISLPRPLARSVAHTIEPCATFDPAKG